MKTYTFTSHSSNETMDFAFNLASKLHVGDVVVLSGELGSGKTKFTEGFLKYFGLENEISSPTFNIVNEYVKNDIKIYHFDVYRLEDVNEFYEIGGDEYFSSGICIIEWGELIEEALPENHIKISFEKDPLDDNVRFLKFEQNLWLLKYFIVFLASLLSNKNRSKKLTKFSTPAFFADFILDFKNLILVKDLKTQYIKHKNTNT